NKSLVSEMEKISKRVASLAMENQTISEEKDHLSMQVTSLQDQLSIANRSKTQLQMAIHEMRQSEVMKKITESKKRSRSKSRTILTPTKQTTVRRSSNVSLESRNRCSVCNEEAFGLSINCSKCGKLYHR